MKTIKSKKKLLIGSAITLVIVLTGFYLKTKTSDDVGVKTVKVEQGPLYSFVRATGRVTSGREAQVGALAAGQIVGVLVQEGQFVANNELLMRLDGREADARAANAEAGLREARGKVEQTKREKEGLEKVWQVGGAALQTLKDAETQLQIALAAKDKADAEFRSASVVREKLRITAPFAGLITKNTAHVGEWATPGAPLITLADAKARELEVTVDDADAGLIAVGQRVEIFSDAFPGKMWVERVVRVEPAVRKEGTSNTITVHVSLASRAQELRFGQQIDARIRTAQQENALKLPFEALISRDNKMFAALISAGKVQIVPVVTGIEDATHVEIVEGLQAGQEALLPEGKRLKEGQRVHKVRDTGAL
jgi:RND family efflux transporter MFP subunit